MVVYWVEPLIEASFWDWDCFLDVGSLGLGTVERRKCLVYQTVKPILRWSLGMMLLSSFFQHATMQVVCSCLRHDFCVTVVEGTPHSETFSIRSIVICLGILDICWHHETFEIERSIIDMVKFVYSLILWCVRRAEHSMARQ